MKKNINLKDCLIILICIIYLFQDILQKIFSIFSYTDEFVTICLFLCYVLSVIKKKKIMKEDFKFFCIIILICFIGIFGNIVNKYQTNYIPILRDMFNTFKVFLSFFGACYFFKENVNKKFIINFLARIIRLIMLVAFICDIISLFKNIGMSNGEIRYGIRSFSFIFSNPGLFAMYIYMYIFILTLDLKYTEKNNWKKIFIFMTLLVWASTLRTRAFIFIILYILLYQKIVKHKKFKLKWYYIVLAAIIAIPIGYESIIKYFGEESTTARNAFLVNSIEIAKDEMPIGTGFGTYGTDVAYKYYSKVYIKYGMSNVYGLSKEFGRFSHDTYWPAIIGQFGVLGTILMIYLIYIFYRKIYVIAKKNKINLLAIIFVMYVTVIASLATATFFHYATAAWFFLLPLMFDEKMDSLEKNN